MAFPSSLTICDLYTCKADEITARVKAEMQDLEHPGLPAPEPGTRLVHNGENHAVTSISPDGVVIMREDEEGNISMPEVISTDTYYAEKQAEIDAQEQEQQPQSGERGEAAQEIASPAEEEPVPVTGGEAVQEETAPGRIPKDEQGQPIYEQADPDTAWDALLEQAGGDEAMAQEVANDIVSEQEKALKAAERELKKVQDGKPQQRKGDAPLTVEARIAAKQAAREQTSRAQAGVDEARKRLEAWRKIAETPQRRRRAIEAERRQEEEESQEAMQKLKDEVVDNQGNPIGENGRLIVEKVNSIEELTDEDFTNPTRSVELPQLPEAVSDAIGANGKPVVIKKNIFEKNKKTHRDLSAQDSRGIIKAALYSPQLYGQNKKTSRPFNWILIHLADKHSSIVIEVNNNKDNYEIVGWHYLDEEALQQKRNQAVREGGLILTIPQIGSAAGNAPENSKASGSKGSEKSEAVQENSQLSQIEQDASDFPFTYMGQQYVVRPIKTDDKGRYTDWFNGKTVRVDNAPEEATMAVFSPNGIVFEGYAARDNAGGEYKLWYKDGKLLDKVPGTEAVREQTSRAQAGVDEARKRLEALNGVPDFIEDRPQDARARGYRRVNGNRVDRQQPIQARRGGEVQVKFDDNNIPTGHAALIEASQLQPSHTDGRRNPRHFIDEAQPKERNDEASVMSSRKIAANIRPEEITSSVTAYTGAPTVNSRGEVIQGNNRSAALREMWAEHPEQAAKYRQYLADHAADFGLTPKDVEAMQQPVLVNMLDVTDDEAITLGQFVAQDTESGGTERIKPKNMVRKMGDDMRGFANRLLASADEEMSFAELVDRNGVDVLKWMQQKGYITPTQYKSAFDSKGNLTAEAKNDLKGVMYQSIFQNGSSHLEEMFNALPAKAQKAILATAYRDYDSPNTERMIEEIQDSISAYYALSQDAAFAGARNYKEARIAAEAWKRQYAFDDATGESYLPSERYSNFALLLATMYKGQTQKFIQNTLGHIYDLVQGTQEADLFNQPDNTPRTLVQAINETLGNLREELLLNENFTYNGQRRSNVLAGGSASGQRGRQGSDGNAPSGGRAEGGAGTATDKGRTVPNDTERGGQGDIRHSSGRQPDGLEASEGEVRLSDEIDENGRQFVLTSNGQLSFGEITKESGLTPAPILLSEGIITNPATNDGYGLVHIEARHGDQIRKAGYKSVIEFIEDVAQNYERVKEGNIRNGNPTYLIQLKDKHNNTLIVELSSDGNYWNINTAGIFKESYGKNRREIYNRHTTVQQSAETVGASQEAEQSGTTTSSSMNAPTSNIVSETPVKTEPQQPNNAVSTGSSLSENEVGGITSSEPNGKPTVSGSKDKKTSAETSQERQKTDSNLSEAFKQQMNIRIGQLSKFIKTKDGKLKKKYESLRKTPFFAIFDSGNIYEGPVAIAKTPREALNVAFNYDIGDFEVLYVDFRTKSLDMDLLSIYDVSGFRGDVYDENGAYKDEAKNLLVERISRLGKGNSTDVQGVEDFQQRESGADALQGNADENIRRAESEVERNPSEAQKEAGNYRKGHVRVDGLDVTIENPKGSVRSGTDADGKRWENVMNNTYGYMRGTEGVDGDHIDVFLSDNPESGNVYVVDQRDPKTGEFDEHKVMYGFGSMEEARDAYLKNYTPGWQGLGTITEVSKEEFRKWIGSSKRKTKPFAEYKSVKKEAGQNEDVRQSRDVSNPLSAEEAAIRDAIVERLRESGIEVITDVKAGQRVLDVANGRGEPVRTQAMLDGLKKASDFILSALGGKTKQRKARIEIPERANRLAEEVIGHPIKSHAININELVHIKKRHGENGTANDANSIPLRDEDIALMPYIMAAPTRVIKGSMTVNGTESVRYEKDLDNGVVVVVEREGRFDVEDMENITMWAKKKPATNVTVAAKASHSTSETIVISEADSAKIRKDAEDAIRGDEKVREHRVYHGSGADFEAFDHSHMRDGTGAVTDDEVSMENDPMSKLAGKSIRTRKQRQAFAERERRRMAGAVREMAERLHLDNVEVVTDASTLTGRRARAKGFYSPRTGKIVIVIPNHASEADAMQTLLHEAVAHYGLRQLFGEHFDTFLWNVYRNADRDVRERINALASDKGWDFPTATEEYLASLAENTDFENAQRSGWWEKIKRLFIDMLHKIGLDGFGGVTLSDNELRYILWRSYENLREPGAERSITGVAADVVKQAELKVGNYAEDATGGDMAAERKSAMTEKQRRIEKLRRSEPVVLKGDEYKGKYELNRESAKQWIKDNLRGEYVNKDTGERIEIRKDGAQKVTSHSMGNEAHLKSLAAIPQMIENSIFIDELPNEKDNGKYDSYRYYVCGLKIGGVDYTAKITVGVKGTSKYYDHALTEIEKGSLLDNIDALSTTFDNKENADNVGFISTEAKPDPSVTGIKDTKLVSILQTDEEENEDELMYRDGGADEDGTRDTPLSSPTVHAWDRLAQSLKFQLRETAVDYLTAIDKFQDLIAKHSGRKIESFENAYDWMTFLTSRNRVEMDMFDSSVVRPLNNAILKLIKNGGTKQPIIFPCVF